MLEASTAITAESNGTVIDTIECSHCTCLHFASKIDGKTWA